MGKIDIFGEDYEDDLYREYGNIVFSCAVIGANQIRGISGGRMTQSTWVTILFEFIFFYIVLTKERGLIDTDSDRRDRVMGELSQRLIHAAVDHIFEFEAGGTRIKYDYMQILSSRFVEYGRHGSMMPEGKSGKVNGTALGALCALVAHLAGETDDVAHIMACQSHVKDSMRVLNMKSFASSATES